MSNDPPLNDSSQKSLLAWIGFGICLKCLAVSLLMGMLLLSVLFTGLHVPVGIEPLSLGGCLKLIYQSALVPVFILIGEILKSLSPWGFVVFAVLVIILKGPDWVRKSLFSGHWKIGGFEYEGSAGSIFKRELNETIGIVEQANKEIEEAYESAKLYASQLRNRFQIGALTSETAIRIAGIIGPSCPDDYRLTLYIPDFLFSDRLYQFSEYYNKAGQQLYEERAGRAFSIRYGIIGRVWRSGVAEIEGELISREDRELLSKDPNHGPIEKFIARRWGLTLGEALRVRQYNSYGAIRLDIAESKVGLVFFDSKLLNAFGNELLREEALTEIKGMLEQSALTLKLQEINHEIASWSGRIQIFSNS